MNLLKLYHKKFSQEMIKELRKLTGASMINCKNAFEKFPDLINAEKYIQEQNLINNKNISSKPSDIGLFSFLIKDDKTQCMQFTAGTDFVINN